ncbi:hypothetical protein [Microcoleus sp. T2B6]|uniref:hypothetical protein n=1 Tax=Microcoleus sp. T2B6 TaxID=3055424 RepID=UPI002FD05E98
MRSPKFTKNIDNIAEGSSATDFVTDVTEAGRRKMRSLLYPRLIQEVGELGILSFD